MVIGILCLCFIQTLTGLLCYAYDLRDKGFEALNAMGCCCSIDHIHFHGAFWANRWQPIQNLDVNQEWRLSIDDLNFYMKFAKNLPESGAGANKMLNLLTSQVSNQTDQISNHQVGEQFPPSLKDLVTKSLSCRKQLLVIIRNFGIGFQKLLLTQTNMKSGNSGLA